MKTLSLPLCQVSHQCLTGVLSVIMCVCMCVCVRTRSIFHFFDMFSSSSAMLVIDILEVGLSSC